jgi:hypothetical protein
MVVRVPYGDPSAGFWFWAGTQPAGPAAPPDPGALAQQLVESMRIRAIDIGILPEPRRADRDADLDVGEPAVGQHLEPISESASAGGITVSVTAKVDRVEWDMGDGTVVTCTSQGTAYADHYGKGPSHPTVATTTPRPAWTSPRTPTP